MNNEKVENYAKSLVKHGLYSTIDEAWAESIRLHKKAERGLVEPLQCPPHPDIETIVTHTGNGGMHVEYKKVECMFNDTSKNSNISGVKKIKKSYYHLQQSEDGRFTDDNTIAWIESDTTEEERIKLADYYTNGQFTKHPGFYQLIGPIEAPIILSLWFLLVLTDGCICSDLHWTLLKEMNIIINKQGWLNVKKIITYTPCYKTFYNMRKLPKVYKHNLAQLQEGVGNRNQKEYCNCDDCVKLRKRRDSIYDKWYHKLKRWCNNHS